MVEPKGFISNPDTRDDNAFQAADDPLARDEIERRAQAEHRAFREALTDHGIDVVLFAPPTRDTPDAVFPNNWFTTHADGVMILYPMRPASRRRERSMEIIGYLERNYPHIVDLSTAEKHDRFLEGTGSLVIDEPRAVVYACESSRTDPTLVSEWAERMGFEPVLFRAWDRDGRAVYHTNVVLSIGSGYCVVCLDAIDDDDREPVRQRLEESGRELITISAEQMHAFCGNVLELENAKGQPIVVMSRRAFDAFGERKRSILERHARILAVPLDTIEAYGGGSARCMLAELN